MSFNHVLLCIIEGFCLSNSLKCTNYRYFLFAQKSKMLSSLSPNIFTLKVWSISGSVKDNISLCTELCVVTLLMLFLLKWQHYTLTKVKKVKS